MITARKWVAAGFGGPEVLRNVEADLPDPRPGQVTGGYTTAITTSASDAFAKPPALTFPEAANLLLAGTTAADLLHTSGAGKGETVLLHGAAGAVGMSVLQQARLLGVRPPLTPVVLSSYVA